MLSPVDIQNKEFKKAKFGGYSVEEVNEFLDEVLEAYETITKENRDLKDKLNMLNENIQYYRTMEATIQNALVLAEKTAQDTKTLAYDRGEQIKKEAEQHAEKIIEQAKQEIYTLSYRIEDLKKQYLGFKVQIKQSLNAQLEILEQQDIITAADAMGIAPKESEDVICEEDTLQNLADEEDFYTKEYTILEDGKHYE